METQKHPITALVKSDSGKEIVSEYIENLIGILTCDPVAALKTMCNLSRAPSTIRDAIFFECLKTFLLNTYRYNPSAQRFEAAILKPFAEALAEASPNADAGYDGNEEKLVEYAKRIIKLIDDCGTNQKARYLASLARAVISQQIDTRKFFQLSRIIRTMTEEDLDFLHEYIREGVHVEDNEEYIDDYCALGLMFEDQKGGYTYSLRAFELMKYSLAYEETFRIPNNLPKKASHLLI